MDNPTPTTTTSGLKASDFIADPDKAIGELRAEIKREIITSNLMFAAVLYFLLQGKGGRGGGL